MPYNIVSTPIKRNGEKSSRTIFECLSDRLTNYCPNCKMKIQERQIVAVLQKPRLTGVEMFLYLQITRDELVINCKGNVNKK